MRATAPVRTLHILGYDLWVRRAAAALRWVHFSAPALLRRLFECGALLSAALIFSATVSLWRLFGIFPYLISYVVFQSIKIVLIDDF